MLVQILFVWVVIITLLLDCGVCSNRPHLIIIVADDLGWNDIGFHGSKQIPTPNIDRLAHEGVILNNYYVQQMCTPTRSALLTGRHPIHTGLQHGVIVGSAPYGLGLNEKILPQYLSPLGYTSRIVGKWHLGFFAKEYTPTYRGFHSHFGYWLGAGDYWDHTAEGGHQGEWGLDFRRNMDLVRDEFGQYSTELFTNESVHIIRGHNQSQPLFLYLAHQAVHSANMYQPLEAPQEYIDKFNETIKNDARRRFAAMTSALDDSVGHVINALNETGMLKNSIILFTSDNGGPTNHYDANVASNWPLRGMKNTLWEGGIRAAGFLWSPLLRTGARVSHQMLHVCDWIPTLMHAIGANMTSLPPLDGVDQWEALSEDKPSARREILHNIDRNGKVFAIRIGDFKLISPDWDNRDRFGWYPPEGSEDWTPPDSRLLFRPSSSVSESLYFNSEKTYSPEVVSQRIQKRSDNYPKRHDLVVDCGPKPANASTNCQPKKPCLYHIPSDPCEYNNLYDREPEIAQMMYTRMLYYNESAVPPKNLPEDPRGFPINNDWAWRPWVTLADGQRDIPDTY